MSKPHGEKEFHYRPNHVDGDRFRENYDTIFRKKEPVDGAAADDACDALDDFLKQEPSNTPAQ